MSGHWLPPDQRVRLVAALVDPLLVADVEFRVERRLRDHQELDGTYACDPHVLVSYVLSELVDAL